MSGSADYPHDDPCDCDDCRRHAVAELTRLGQEQAHLPECLDYSDYEPGPSEYVCICDRLRACEMRLFVDRTDHWNAALDAARGAVAAVEMGGEHFWSVGFRDGITIALDAIDALLKEKP